MKHYLFKHPLATWRTLALAPDAITKPVILLREAGCMQASANPFFRKDTGQRVNGPLEFRRKAKGIYRGIHRRLFAFDKNKYLKSA